MKASYIVMVGATILFVCFLIGHSIGKGLPCVVPTNAPPGFRAVEYGEGWNRHTYLIYERTYAVHVLHAEHCRGYHPNFIIVTNITYVTLTNTLTEIPDEVWKRYEELRRK